MQHLKIPIGTDQEGLITVLWEHDTVGIIEGPEYLEAFFEDWIDVSDLVTNHEALLLHQNSELADTNEYTELPDCDPVLAGHHFFIVPSSSRVPTMYPRIRLEIDAFNAFGSGRHESTQLVISGLEQYLQRRDLVLDVGSGSGILSLVSHELGASEVVACDTHAESLLLTQRQAPSTSLFQGSVDAVAGAQFDIVIANISQRVIDKLSYHLVRACKPQGWLILSGFVRENPPKLFVPTQSLELNDWLCWVCRPESYQSEACAPDFDSHSQVIQPFEAEWW